MKPPRLILLVLCLGAFAFLLYLALPHPTASSRSAPTAPPTSPPENSPPASSASLPIENRESKIENSDAALLHAALQRLAAARDARPQEALLTFTDADAYRRFLARAQHRGLAVLGQLDALLAVRIRYEDLAALESELAENHADYAHISANFLVDIPAPPAKADRAALNQIPFRNTTLAFLGAATADRTTWGRGVTLAVLDTGVAPDPTFTTERIRYLNLGLGTLPGAAADDGHGTSVAALAAGAAPDAAGLAPAASILSIRVTDDTSRSDLFTIAHALLAATDAGASIVNLSLGGYATATALSAAIDYARSHGVVIVAAAGNDQAAQLAWPAADPRVISVGAVDALGQQVAFSNSGPQLQLAAPGYGVQTAWLDGQRVYVNGTSASAPLVAGAIAAVMSQNPGYTADRAWDVIRQTASDAGAPGPDPDYGNGVLNLDWAMHAANPTRVDPAVSSHYYDAAHQQMEFVVQNRGAQSVANLSLDVDTSGSTKNYRLPAIPAGSSYVVKIPVDSATLAANQGLTFTTQLVTPFGLEDANVANNRLTTRLPAPTK